MATPNIISGVSAGRKLEADATPGPVINVNAEKLIDEIPAGVDYKKLMEDQAFMAEVVVIMLHPLGQAEAEPMVPVSVQGHRVLLTPGVPSSKDLRSQSCVRRYHVAQLMKARPDYVTHRGGSDNAHESTHNRLFKQSTSRYNFDVLEDTPKGIAWLRELRRQYTRR